MQILSWEWSHRSCSTTQSYAKKFFCFEATQMPKTVDSAQRVKYCGLSRDPLVEANYDDPRLPTPMIGHIINQKRNRDLEMQNNVNVNPLIERTVSERKYGQSTVISDDSSTDGLFPGFFEKQMIRGSLERSPQTFGLTQFDYLGIPSPLCGHHVNVTDNQKLDFFHATILNKYKCKTSYCDCASREIPLSPSDSFFQHVPLFPHYDVTYSPAAIQSTINETFSDFKIPTSHGKYNFHFYILR